MGSRFGIGEGTAIQLFVSRVLAAILDCEDDLVKWPQPGTEQYQRTIHMHLHLHGFPNCLGFSAYQIILEQVISEDHWDVLGVTDFYLRGLEKGGTYRAVTGCSGALVSMDGLSQRPPRKMTFAYLSISSLEMIEICNIK